MCLHMHLQTVQGKVLWGPLQHTFSAALNFLLAAKLWFPQLFMSHLLGQVLCQMCVK